MAMAERSVTEPVAPETRSILIVDDNPANLSVIVEYLAAQRFQVRVARDGEAGLQSALLSPPDLVLLDVMLPGIDGFETCRRLKADARTREIPVIFMTILTSVEDKVRGLQVGGVDYITKPFQAEEVLARVRTHLTLHTLHQQLAARNVQLGLEISDRKRAEDALQKAHDGLELRVEERTAEVRQANRMLRILSECNQAVVRALGEPALLQEICRIIVDLGGYPLVFVGYAEEDEVRSVRPVVQIGFQEGYLEALGMTWAETDGETGPAGAAIRTGTPCIVRDIPADQDFARPREGAARRGAASAIAVPLESGGRVFGALSVLTTQAGAFDPGEVSLLSELASDLAFGIVSLWERTERWRAEEETRRRLGELEAVHRISTVLRSAQELASMLPTLLDELLAVIGSDAGCIWLYDPESDELSGSVARGWLTDVSRALVRPGQGIVGSVFSTGKPQLSRELTLESVLEGAPGGWGGACVPIRTAERIVGVLLIAVRWSRVVTEDEERLLTTLAEIAGNSIHRMRLHLETDQHLQRLNALRAIDAATTGSLDLHITLDVVLDQVLGQLRADAADVLLFNDSTRALDYATGKGFRGSWPRRPIQRVGESLAGRIVLERAPVYVHGPAEAGPDWNGFGQQADEGFVAYFGVPLIAKGQVKGVLEVFHRTPLRPRPEWLGFLGTLAARAAIAIENITLFEALKRSNQELTVAYDATLEGWSRALELRDQGTEGHTRRVAELTVRLAAIMGMADAERVHARRGALLHDIGKMGIPDSILQKPGPLSAEEWEIMRRHPLYAFEMLHPIPYLRPALDIPMRHHEKWDGTGYPSGLEGERIPLAARVFAVVDVWDAVTCDRPYRKAWEKGAAVEYIRSLAGTHFDPLAVEAFLNLIAEGDAVELHG